MSSTHTRTHVGAVQQVTQGQVEHKPGCTGEAITRHNGTRFAQLTCQGCGAIAVVPRDTDRWQR